MVITHLFLIKAASMDFTKLKKDQLVDYLKKRDFPTNNLRKADLQSLCERVQQLDLPILIEEDDSSCVISKFLSVGTAKIRLPSSTSMKKKLTEMPQLEMSDVFSFLVTSCQWSSNRLKRHKQDDGYRLFMEKHIDKVQIAVVSA
jgi:hypothetical protein